MNHAEVHVIDITPCLPCLSVLGLSVFLGQAMLLEESINLVGAPEMMINLARLGFSYRCELDCGRLAGMSGMVRLHRNILFSLLNLVESIVLLKTLTASPHASLRSHSSL
jgi:hypothetical protein